MQQVDDPPFIAVGTEVSAKYKGAFCEAKVSKVVRNIKVRVAYKQGLGSGIVSDDAIKASAGQLRVGAMVEVRHPERKEYVEATITKIQDSSQYTVVFDDGDITTLRRSALCMKSGRHFNESETLDQLPLTHPEHFGNPVVGGRRGRRRGQLNGDSSEEDEESDAKEVIEKEEDIGKVILFEPETKKKEKEKLFPGLVVAPTAQATERIRVKDEYLVRSFKDGRYYTVPKKEAIEFPRQFSGNQQNSPAFQAALRYLNSNVLPPHWDRDTLFAISNSSSCEEVDIDSDSSEDEPSEEKDRFVAQLYKFMDDRGTPLNKSPSIHNRDIDLYRLFRAVQKRGGYNRVSSKNQWKHIVVRLGFTPVSQSVKNLVKQAYKKFLQPYCEFNRKLGCSLLMPSSRTGRGKGRSLVRANSVASPKTVDSINNKGPSSTIISTTPPVTTAVLISTTGQQSGTEESGNLSESSVDTLKNKKKISKTKPIVAKDSITEIVIKKEPLEPIKEDSPGVELKSEHLDQIKDEADIPLSKIKAAATASANAAAAVAAATAVVLAASATPCSSTSITLPASGSCSTSSRSSEDSKEKKHVPNIKEEKSKTEPSTRDSSPSDRSSKKDKHQRKQTPQSDDKRSKRRRDEVSVDKYGTGDSLIEVNDKLQVYYHEKKTYECKVLEITLQRGTPMYLVHYTGWNTRYDEWVPFERIAENITKGTKFKTRFSGNSEKNKDKDKSNNNSSSGSIGSNNPTSTHGGNLKPSTSTSSSSSIADQTKSQSTLVKRGRGRSDSFPPRSTTPSSGASNSSRTKSPATSSSLKKRQVRASSSTSRKATASANASDVSMLTDDSDSDSDEPVRRPKRKPKDASYKSKSSCGKSASKSKQNSANNSATDSENDDDDEDGTSSSIRTLSRSASDMGSKGRDYDLNQIRSELKGFRDLKTPPASNTPSTIDSNNSLDDKELKIKSEIDFDDGRSVSSTEMKLESKIDIKEELTDSSTGMDSLVDDDSQSSDKTTTLKNMSKKFQQKINAEKQRAFEKSKSSNVGSIFSSSEKSTSSGNVEKIIKESQAETKRHEILKAKVSPEDIKIKKNRESESPFKSSLETNRKHHSESKDEDKKQLSVVSSELKPSVFHSSSKNVNTSNSTISSGSVSNSSMKFSLIHVEKSQSYSKKLNLEPNKMKKSSESTPQKSCLELGVKKHTENTLCQKDFIKIDAQSAGSPCSSSSSSSSCSFGTSSSVHSARSLPDMSKLEISGSSSSSPCSSVYAPISKETKYSPPKANSPDIYEFKDPEPFEYEVRKSPMVSSISHIHTSTSTPIISQTSAISHSKTNSPSTSARKLPATKLSPLSNTINLTEHSATLSMSILKGTKKRGSPYKEAVTLEKSKHSKHEEKMSLFSTSSSSSTSIVADAKLIHHPAHSSEILKLSKTSPNQTKIHSALESSTVSNKVVTQISVTSPQSLGSTASTTLSYQKHKDCNISPNQSSTTSTTIGSNVSAFDALRKSGNVNVNINALNEELATAKKAFTDVLLVNPTSPVTLETQQIKTEPVTPVKSIKAESNSDDVSSNATPTTTTTTSTITATSSNSSTSSNIHSKASLPSTPTSSSNATPAQAAVTPPQPIVSKPVIGSPFIETRKDLSNVFELSSNDGTSSGLKEHKFELENAKILLSSSAGGAFDLDPVKYESKPTSIADKVLKAISQKKEVENKQKEATYKLESDKDKTLEQEKEKESKVSLDIPCINQQAILKDLGSITSNITIPLSVDTFTLSSSLHTLEPLKINTDLPSSLTSLPSLCTVEKLISKKSSLVSPECKSILESKPIQKSDLSETIQKLESAIQRKTPIAGLSTSTATTPTPSVPTIDTFSDDSTDSTDSERRLVIEDISEEQQDSQKSPIIPQNEILKEISPSGICAPVKLDTTEKAKIITSNIVPTPQGIQTPIPLKLSVTPQKAPLLYTAQSVQVVSATSPTNPVAGSNGPLKIPANIPQVLSTPIKGSLVSPQQLAMSNIKGIPHQISLQFVPSSIPRAAGGTSALLPIGSGCLQESKKEDISFISKLPTSGTQINLITNVVNPQQRTEAVVPVVLPEIPGPLVVASDSSMPLTVVKSQVQQQPLPQIGIPSLEPLPVTALVKNIGAVIPVSDNNPHVSQHQSATIRVTSSEPLQQVLLSKSTLQTPQTILAPSTSGFYLNPHKELRPEDGVIPLQAQTPPMQDKPRSAPSMQGDSLSSSKLNNAQSESINLLCEESIPGSPPPVSTTEDDTLPNAEHENIRQPTQTQRNVSHCSNESKVDMISINSQVVTPSNLVNSSGITPTPPITNTPSNAPNIVHQSSSPNDSASQDESSEDLKKNMDIENDVSPRKRRRTRKQSEVVVLGEQHSKKRKQHMSSIKKNAVGSDSEDNSDMNAQRGQSTRHILQPQQQQHQIMQQHQQHYTGIRPCPYNFLVQLDPGLPPEQSIEIIQKQMNEIRKTYNMLKNNLASIDRRRKKYRRREREKKQLQMQQQQQQSQQIKISS